MSLTTEQLQTNAAAMIAFASGGLVECRPIGDSDEWVLARSPRWDCQTYLYRPKPEPKTRLWCKPDDVPGPVCWIRYKNRGHQLITYVSDSTLIYGGSQMLWEQIEGYEYSTDRKTWKPCTVEVSE